MDNYIFDLYGTLVDIHTDEQKESLWNKMSRYLTSEKAFYSSSELRKAYYHYIDEEREKNLSLRQLTCPEGEILNLNEIEVDLHEIVQRLYTSKNINPSEKQIADFCLNFRLASIEKLELFEGALDLLIRLREAGKKIYLLSNAQRLFTEPEMRKLGIYDFFDAVFYSSDIGFVKPSTHFYHALLDTYHLDGYNSCMIGNDWQADAWGAHNVGLPSMYIHTKQSPTITGSLPPNCLRLKNISDVYPGDGVVYTFFMP